MWKFDDPIYFLLLIPAGIFFFFFFRSEEKKRWMYTSSILKEAFPHRSWRVRTRRIPVLIFALSTALIICALSRPQKGKVRHRIIATGIDMVLVLDASGSMKALDFSEKGNNKTRFEVAKEVIEDFIKKRKGDRIGLVVFGAYAYTQCPITLDYSLLAQFLDELEVGVAGDSTALGEAIGLAVKRLSDSKAKSRIVIALTDGRNNAGQLTPREAAEIAKTMGVKVYTIGIGKEGPSPFLMDTLFGKRIVYQRVDLDEDTLREVAAITGGRYFRVRSAGELQEVYDTIDRLEKTRRKIYSWAEYDEKYRWFLLPAFVLSLIAFAGTFTMWRKLP